MWKSFILVALLSIVPAIANGANADDEKTTLDIRCLIVAMKMEQQTELQSFGQMAGIYYLGRLEGRNPTLDLEGKIGEELQRMAPNDISSEAKRCGQEMQESGKAFAQIGRNLIKRGNEMLEKEKNPGTSM